MTESTKAPELIIREAFTEYGRRRFGRPDTNLTITDFELGFVIEQRAAARAEAFEEAALVCNEFITRKRSRANIIQERIRNRAAQEANHD